MVPTAPACGVTHTQRPAECCGCAHLSVQGGLWSSAFRLLPHMRLHLTSTSTPCRGCFLRCRARSHRRCGIAGIKNRRQLIACAQDACCAQLCTCFQCRRRQDENAALHNKLSKALNMFQVRPDTCQACPDRGMLTNCAQKGSERVPATLALPVLPQCARVCTCMRTISVPFPGFEHIRSALVKHVPRLFTARRPAAALLPAGPAVADREAGNAGAVAPTS